MKVCFFIPRFACGGAERVMCTLALRLCAEKTCDVEMLVNRNDGELKDFIDGKISVKSLGAKRLWRGLIPLIRHLRDKKPDVLIATLPGPILLSFLAIKIARLRTGFVARQANMIGSIYSQEESSYSLIKQLGDALFPLPLSGADAVCCSASPPGNTTSPSSILMI